MFLTNSYLPMWSTFYSEYVFGKKRTEIDSDESQMTKSCSVFTVQMPNKQKCLPAFKTLYEYAQWPCPRVATCAM